MRIISGKYKGRHISVHKKFSARPTTDFAKENLFNVLSNHFQFEDLSVLDLFSGTGSVSFEFVSRGCQKVVSVEKDYKSHSFIKKTAIELEMQNLVAIKSDMFKYVEWCNDKFDIVFADPPFNLERLDEIPNKVFESNIIANNGWLILEHGKTNNFSGNQHLIDTRKYGSVHFSIFQLKKD